MSSASDNHIDISSRKNDHIRLCLENGSEVQGSVFDKYQLPYTALPEMELDDVDTSYALLGKKLATPLVIASMTGGSEHGRTINTNLAIAAEECGVAMGLGSQRIGLEKTDANDTFELVRKKAPSAFIFANMGVAQLNYGHGIESYQKVVDMVQADARDLHLNPRQEAIQPGGDTDFSGLLEKIHELTSKVSVPVFAKEVGHGISGPVAAQLFQAGLAGVDVAGVGGTSYAWVEAKRAHNNDFCNWFKSVGIPTDKAVEMCSEVTTSDEQIIVASGGVRSPVDGLISRALGADLFSAASPFLEPAMTSPEAIIEVIQNWQQGLRVIMFSAGLNDWQAAQSLKLSAYHCCSGALSCSCTSLPGQ